MNLYYSHIVEVLNKNVGITREELYKISGITSKRAFITEINYLLATDRITTLHERLVYAPKVLYLYEIDDQLQEVVSCYQLNFVPTELLKSELGFITEGPEHEYSFEYALEIAGYEIKEEKKHIFENSNNIVFNYAKFKYVLKAEYLFLKQEFI